MSVKDLSLGSSLVLEEKAAEEGREQKHLACLTAFFASKGLEAY